jgi:restriction system protein
MSRRSTIFDDVMRMPWPVGVVAAIMVFILQQVMLAIEPQSIVGYAFKTPVKMLGYFFITMFLLASFFSFLNQVIRAKRFGSTKSLADIRSLTWRQFESFTAEAYKRQGYSVIETPEGPDNGVDLVLRKDGEKTYVQCKHWKASSVGVEKIRELLGSMTAGGAHNGIFVTSGQYTAPAREFASECGIELVDSDGLAVLIGDLTGEQNAFCSDHATTSSPDCPICNSSMVKRVAKRGTNRGAKFWGCSKYPGCHGTRQL